MTEDRENITWQPISFLPQIAEMINGMLDASRETFEPLCQVKVHDDYTIKRIFEVTGQQVEDEWMYDEQLKIWLDTSELKERRWQGSNKRAKPAASKKHSLQFNIRGVTFVKNTVPSIHCQGRGRGQENPRKYYGNRSNS